MAFYKTIKTALSKLDAVVGATNSSFKILNDFIKKTEDKSHPLMVFTVYFNKDQLSLTMNYVVYDVTDDTATIGPVGKSIFDTEKWSEMIPVDRDDRKIPENAQILWDSETEYKVEEDKLLKRQKLNVYKGFLSYPDGDKKITIQAQHLCEVKFIKEVTQNQHFVKLFLRQGNVDYPSWYIGYDYFYYLYAEMDDGSQTIIATVSCGWETSRIEGAGLEIVR